MPPTSRWRCTTRGSSWWGCSLHHPWWRHHTAGRCSTWQILCWAGSGGIPELQLDPNASPDGGRKREDRLFWIGLFMLQVRERNSTTVTRPCWLSSHTLGLMGTQRPKPACSTQLNNPSSCPPLKSKGSTGWRGAGASEATESKQLSRRCSGEGEKSLSAGEWTCTSTLFKLAGVLGSSFLKNTTPSAVRAPALVHWEKI